MNRCPECRKKDCLSETLLLEYTEDLGGIIVTLVNSVKSYRCGECGAEEIEIPDLRGLVRTVAVERALVPLQLSGKDIKFIRKALDMTQSEFADAMEISQETVSRWENDVRGIGGATEKLVRHNVCALLRDMAPAADYDPAMITKMKIVPSEAGQLQPFRMERVPTELRNHSIEDAWKPPMAA